MKEYDLLCAGRARRLRAFPFLIVLASLALLSACTRVVTADPYIDLAQRVAIPIAADVEVVPLRIAVAAIISPQGTAASYGGLAAYLGNELARPVELVQRKTYEEVNALVAVKGVDLAFICTSAYLDGKASGTMELLVAPQIGGAIDYRSILIVPVSSKATSMADLRGQVFAFTDPISFSGRVYPTHLVQSLGSTPDEFFARTFFTYSHDRAILAVADGIADGANVDSLVLDYALARDASLAARIRIVDRSPAFGIPPVVVPLDLHPRQRLQLQEALLNMDKSHAGQLVLAELGIERFVVVTDDLYDSARALTAQTQGIEWMPQSDK